MDYLLTWVEGEEVCYKIVAKEALSKLTLEDNKPFCLTELKSGKEIRNLSELQKNN